MKKMAFLLMFLLSFAATDAKAMMSIYSHAGNGQIQNDTTGKWYDYDYTITSAIFQETVLAGIGDWLTIGYLNTDLPTDSGNFTMDLGPIPYSYTMNYELLSTPLPAALPMFAAALIGTGFYRRRKTA